MLERVRMGVGIWGISGGAGYSWGMFIDEAVFCSDRWEIGGCGGITVDFGNKTVELTVLLFLNCDIG